MFSTTDTHETEARSSAATAEKPARTEKRVLACQECGAAFKTHRWDAVFCSPKCRDAVKVRERGRAATLYRMMMDHRRGRGRGVVQFGDVTAQLDRWIAEDRLFERAIGDIARIEEPAEEVRRVAFKGREVGQVERVGPWWYWRPKAASARRVTDPDYRSQVARAAVPLRYMGPRGSVDWMEG